MTAGILSRPTFAAPPALPVNFSPVQDNEALVIPLGEGTMATTSEEKQHDDVVVSLKVGDEDGMLDLKPQIALDRSTAAFPAFNAASLVFLGLAVLVAVIDVVAGAPLVPGNTVVMLLLAALTLYLTGRTARRNRTRVHPN